MDKIIKSPSEAFPIEIDFANDLGDEEDLSSFALTCIDSSTGESSSSTIVLSSSSSGNIVTVVIQAGTERDLHKITIAGTTDMGNIFNKEILVEIQKDICGEFFIQPADEFVIKLNFEEDLRNLTGESIVSFAIEIFDEEGTDISASVLSGESVIDGDDVLVGIQAPDTIETFMIHGEATTTNAYVFDIYVRMRTVEM